MMNDLSPFLIHSFAQNRGSRGVHFYDSKQCEFMTWNEVMGKAEDKLPEQFYDKLIEAVANYDPESEFVTVTAGDGQLTIEMFRSESIG
jgi:hypothetical protein